MRFSSIHNTTQRIKEGVYF